MSSAGEHHNGGMRALHRAAAAGVVLALACGSMACGSATRDRRSMMMAEAAAANRGVPQPGTTGVAQPGTTGPARLGPNGAPVPGQIAAAPQVLDDATYRLAPGDLLDVKFPYHPEENERVPVRPDGRIGLQSAGDVIAAGLTVKELEQSIVDKASTTLRNPVVSVVIVQLAEHKVYVGGDVAKPGFVQFRDGLTPLEAIIERGGFLDTAKADQVLYITRAGEQVQAQRIDLQAVIQGQGTEEVVLAPDDILFVPKTWIGEANVWVDQWVRGLLPTVPRPGFDLNAVAF